MHFLLHPIPDISFWLDMRFNGVVGLMIGIGVYILYNTQTHTRSYVQAVT